VFDGLGGEAIGTVTQAGKRKVLVQIGEIHRHAFDAAYRLTLAVAMGKAHRQAYLVEKCTELGVAGIWPIISERSVTRPGEAAVEKWARRAIEAAKQCGRRWVPVIEPPQRFEDVLKQAVEFDRRLVAEVGPGSRPLLETLAELAPGASMFALIGPEGGWSPREQAMARSAGLAPVSLSPTVLRTETAAVAVCAAVALLSGRAGRANGRDATSAG
jgi:16S rRNA (uracil1498-N3)-methyltransferase